MTLGQLYFSLVVVLLINLNRVIDVNSFAYYANCVSILGLTSVLEMIKSEPENQSDMSEGNRSL